VRAAGRTVLESLRKRWNSSGAIGQARGYNAGKRSQCGPRGQGPGMRRGSGVLHDRHSFLRSLEMLEVKRDVTAIGLITARRWSRVFSED
jgi:hypothetical protein